MFAVGIWATWRGSFGGMGIVALSFSVRGWVCIVTVITAVGVAFMVIVVVVVIRARIH